MYEDLINQLRFLAKVYSNCERENTMEYKLAIDAANAIEELLKAAKSMHTWIFLNSANEQEVYDEEGTILSKKES